MAEESYCFDRVWVENLRCFVRCSTEMSAHVKSYAGVPVHRAEFKGSVLSSGAGEAPAGREENTTVTVQWVAEFSSRPVDGLSS